MRYIKKGSEPRSLKNHRNQAGARYENYRHTSELRKALVNEQGYICCYCCSRIYPNSRSMVIEHWKPQSKYSKLELNYNNILASCTGGINSSDTNAHHCDKKKANRELEFSPADKSHMIEDKIFYEVTTGKIKSNSPTFDKQLKTVLNLNTGHFKEQRKRIFDAIIEWKRKKNPTRQTIKRAINRLSFANGKFEEFDPIRIWLLKKFIS